MWALLTISAIFFQIIRNLEQKKLHKDLDVFTTSWSRFILPFPFAIIAVISTFQSYNFEFFHYILINALFQILGNIFLIKTIQTKNFSVGIAFSKTEIIQALILGFLLYNFRFNFNEILAIFIAFIGIILLAKIDFKNFKDFTKSLKNIASLYGILCGFCFGITSYNIQFASNYLISDGFNSIKASTLVLLYTIFFQNIFFIIFKSFQKRLFSDVKKLFLIDNYRKFLITSLSSFVGSICWYGAYTVGNVIHVKTVGQLEIIASMLVAKFHFKEKNSIKENLGIIFIIIAILLIILF
jgi:drug/metabolite transporter (DMT)-like permease